MHKDLERNLWLVQPRKAWEKDVQTLGFPTNLSTLFLYHSEELFFNKKYGVSSLMQFLTPAVS